MALCHEPPAPWRDMVLQDKQEDIDKYSARCYADGQVNNCFSAPERGNSAEGRIENRVKFPNGTATVSVEVPHLRRKPVIGVYLREGHAGLLRRKSGELLE